MKSQKSQDDELNLNKVIKLENHRVKNQHKENLKEVQLSKKLTNLQILLDEKGDKESENRFLETTRNPILNNIVLESFIGVSITATVFFSLLFIFNSQAYYCYAMLWVLFWGTTQYFYLYYGLLDCFGTKDRKGKRHLYAHAHDIFFLTTLYIIFNIALLLASEYAFGFTFKISDVMTFISIIIAFSSISLDGKISSINAMTIILSIFLLTQFGLYLPKLL